MDNDETAIVRDLIQTGDNGVKGDWYDEYIEKGNPASGTITAYAR
jgi:hypothetical protein